MDRKEKTKEQLIEEIKELRQEVEYLKSKEAESAIHYIKDLIWHEQESMELRLDTEQLFAIISSARDAIFVKNKKLEYTFVNPALEKLYARSSEEIIGKTDQEIFGEDRGRNMETFDTDVLKGKNREGEHSLDIKGNIITFRVDKTPLQDSAGGIIGICGIARDITEKKFFEEAIERNQEQLLAIIDTTRDAILIKDKDLRYIRANPAVENLFAISPASLLGRTDEEIFGTEVGKHMKRYDNSVLRGRIIEEETTREVRGVTTTFETVKAPMRNEKGEIVGICAISRDVTEHRLAEMAYKKSQSEYQALLDAMPDLVLQIRKDGTIYDGNTAKDFKLIQIEVNKELHEEVMEKEKEIEGIKLKLELGKLERLVGKNLRDVFPQDMVEEAIRGIEEAMQYDEVQVHEYQYKIGNEMLYYDMRVTAIDKENLVIIIRDITERMLAEQELLQRNEELDAFSHTVAHDLKNPLAGLIGYGDFLKKNYEKLSDAIRQNSINKILDNAQKMKNIISELLLLAGVRKQEIETHELDMAKIVEDAQLRLDYMIRRNEAEIIFPESWPPAMGYAPWIEEVWANYMSNAIKYGGEPPRMELGSTILDNGMIKFWVKDNGKGLTEEEKSRLFTEFTRLHQVRAQGQGLGLSIVRRILNKLDGDVGVESEIDKGSVFSFYLPAAKN